MEGKVKPKNKYPYIEYIKGTEYTQLYTVVNPWIKENIGLYRDKWFCDRGIIKYEDKNVSSLVVYHPYAFKYIEDAMAFKLRWL